MKMQKKAERAVERKKERKEESCSLFLINTRKKVFEQVVTRVLSCVNGSPITIQKTDKNTEQKSMDEKKKLEK